MDLFTDITQYQQIFVFFKCTKIHLQGSIYHVKCSKSTKFHKNSWDSNYDLTRLVVGLELVNYESTTSLTQDQELLRLPT